ncbi:hypothetical protein Tco_0761679 [Tanacetum coccineum]
MAYIIGSDGIYKPGRLVHTSDRVSVMLDAAEAVHIILNGICNYIYSIVDACANSKEIWFYKMMNGEKQVESIHHAGKCSVPATTSTRMVKVEFNEIRAETLARIANLLALKQPPSTRSYATTRNKGKEIVKAPLTPLESDREHESDGEQTQRD